MHIGFDIDGTITRHPAFFAFLARSLRSAGHRVTIITYRHDRASAAADLAAMEVSYDALVAYDPERTPPPDFDRWKGDICAELGVEVFFEDRPETLNHLPPSTVGLLVVAPEEGLVFYD
jgi:NAD(P)-dependent dehydrogenase (short-subunit alcohol dehydrogenase family)